MKKCSRSTALRVCVPHVKVWDAFDPESFQRKCARSATEKGFLKKKLITMEVTTGARECTTDH